MKLVFKVVLPLLFLLFAVVAYVVLGQLKTEPQKREEPPQAVAVFVESAERVQYTQTVLSQGEVQPQREIIVAPQVAGRIDYLSQDFLVGSFVQRGQTLARVEVTDFELALVRAEATVAGAEQALARERAEAEVAIQDITDLGLSMEQASPLARREPQLAQAEADLKSAIAQLRDAELALSRTTIVAPFDGVISEKSVDIGQFVSLGFTLGRMYSTDTFEVALPLTDTEVGRIGLPLAFNETSNNPGPEVILSAEVAGQPRQWIGRITRTGAVINSQTRQINIFAEIDDPYGAGRDGDAAMVPGQFVNATIDGDTLDGVVRVSRDALRGTNRVLVADSETDSLSIRTVDVALSNPGGAYLLSGVAPGEEVVVSPIETPTDGMRVQILRQLDDGTVERDELAPDASDQNALDETPLASASADGTTGGDASTSN